MLSTTQTLSQIKSQEFISHMKQQFTTSHIRRQWHSRFCKNAVIQKLGSPQPLFSSVIESLCFGGPRGGGAHLCLVGG